MHRFAGMMLALIANVLLDPLQVLCAKTYHAVAGLPFQHFLMATEFLIGLVDGGAFEFADQIADQNGGGNADG
jgi:hypothetical protein